MTLLATQTIIRAGVTPAYTAVTASDEDRSRIQREEYPTPARRSRMNAPRSMAAPPSPGPASRSWTRIIRNPAAARPSRWPMPTGTSWRTTGAAGSGPPR
jgi:hypothetical protein